MELGVIDVGVSCWLSGQHRRCKHFYLEYSFRKRYMGFGNLFQTG